MAIEIFLSLHGGPLKIRLHEKGLIMKKRVVVLVVMALVIPYYLRAIEGRCCKDERYRSFLFSRPLNQNVPLYQSMWHDYIYEKQGSCKTSFQCIGAYQESLNTRALNKYFLFDRKTEVSVIGDAAVGVQDRDVRAEWLGLPSNFYGALELVPKQRQVGIFLNAHQDLNKFIAVDFFDGYWIDVNVPLVAVQNSIEIKQRIGATTTSASVSDFVQAFNRADLRYAKISSVSRSRLRCPEINIRFGRAYLSEDHFQVVYYSGISAPLGNKQDAAYVFDPVVGNNGHWGFLVGAGFQVVTSRCSAPYATCLFLHVENIFFMHNTQHRTLDVRDKPWSRYMLLNHRDRGPEQNVPASSILTRRVKVHPYGMVDLSAGGRIFYQDWHIEAGYNLWAHARERIELKKSFPAVWGFAGIKDIANPTVATTASLSTIAKQAANDADFVPIQEGDLYVRSGAALGTLVHKIHVSLGWGRKGAKFDGFFGVGAWFETPQHSGACKAVGCWLKLGGSF